jgi:anti-anti-sigma factor
VKEHLNVVSVLSIDGPLRAPTTSRLRGRVGALLDQGERAILLDMAAVPEIDAAGVGELVAAYTMAAAVGGVFGIARPPRRVRRLLDHARVGDILCADAADPVAA